MQKKDGVIYYSASDIVNYLDCEHLTTLDIVNLETPLPQAGNDEEAILFQDKGLDHERAYLDHLRRQSLRVADISVFKDSLGEKVAATREAMKSGTDIIYQAALRDDCFIGHADFLRRVSTPSILGDFSYEAIDTKLSRSARVKYLVQLCYYSELVATSQGREPRMMHIVLGDGREESFRFADYSRYYRSLKERFLHRVKSGQGDTYPNPRERCDLCRWRNLCEERRINDDHLCQVANITRQQIKKLHSNGVTTLEALARIPKKTRIPKLVPETLLKLRSQAALQLKKRLTGENQLELLPSDPDTKRGLARLPKPDDGDIFFDIEGDPLENDGLEYLLGIHFFKQREPQFISFWAHSRKEERIAFEHLMDFITGHLRMHPRAHIYHYAHYEETALKRLMSRHGTREIEVDNLLRFGKLVDLYKVVRESVRISEPSYSLKSIEAFYRDKRDGPVKDAGMSIVCYERWKKTEDTESLKAIEDYNREDLKSTRDLRQWLLGLRPSQLPWASDANGSSVSDQDGIDEMNEAEKRLVLYRERLVDSLPEDRKKWSSQDQVKELVYQLLDFHRRADKPAWWAFFTRMEMTPEELVEDVECIGAMTRAPGRPQATGKKTAEYVFHYPDQETKLKTGDNCVFTDDTRRRISSVEINEDDHTVTLRCSGAIDTLPKMVSIGPAGPIETKTMREALFRFADDLIDGGERYRSLVSLLNSESPRIKGHERGCPVIDESAKTLPQIIEAVANLDRSYIFIQGPPGAGKTFTGAHIIVDLLRRGHRVGVTSNSHKAINNLLKSVEDVAGHERMVFRGVKKSVSGRPDSTFGGKIIEDVFNNKKVHDGNWQLVAGTAWLFSSEQMDGELDYLFVDEAGQVSLANLIAMGTSSRNIVLLGDQMQLAQPIQGVHPGRSGESTLEYLLKGEATISPEKGIFLKDTWRMHQDVCRFISEAVYDGRLEPRPENNLQRLILRKEANSFLRPTGIRYVPVEHSGCSQQSDEEAAVVLEIYQSLLKQRYTDKEGVTHPVTSNNILIVAPYNMQVNLLRRTLPRDARIGTVDKFQGQEAEVVIVSMATSSGDDLPRQIEFLYSKNRLNVAISRARCLAMLVANPALMSVSCSTPEQMALVNTLCWVRDYSLRQGA